MPYVIKKTGPTSYGLYNIDKHIWKSYNTTLEKVKAQERLLHYVDSIKYR